MSFIKQIKRWIPWEWKYYTKRWIGSFSFDQKEFDKIAQLILERVKQNKQQLPKNIKLPQKKLKIIFSVHQFFPKHYSGTERYLLNIATEIQKMGHNILIVTYDPSPNTSSITKSFVEKKYEYEGLRVITINSFKQKTNDSLLEKNSEIRNFYTKLFKKEKPDIFHIIQPMYAYEGFRVAKQNNIRTVMSITDYWLLCQNTFLLRNDHLPCFGPKNGSDCSKHCFRYRLMNKRYDLAKNIFMKSNAIIFTSQFVDEIFKINNFENKKTCIVRHGFGYSNKKKHKKQIKDNTFVFGYTGTILPFKGVHQLIYAFKLIPNENIRLKIYGDTSNDIEYANYIKKMASHDTRISFMGRYLQNEEEHVHNGLNCVVVPSIVFETFSLVSATSLYYGVPIIAPDISGTNGMVTQTNGKVFHFGSVEDLSKKMLDMTKVDINESKIKYNISLTDESMQILSIYLDVL